MRVPGMGRTEKASSVTIYLADACPEWQACLRADAAFALRTLREAGYTHYSLNGKVVALGEEQG